MTILSDALDCYNATKDYDRSVLSPIWQSNIDQHFSPLLATATDPVEVLRYLQDKAFFDVSVGPPQLPYALDWFAERMGGAQLIPEAASFSDSRCEVRDGVRLSTDVLWRQMLVWRMVNNIGCFNRVLELGSGSGNLARVMRLMPIGVEQHVLVDLPESLFCAQLFLRLEFPNAKFHYVRDIDDAKLAPADCNFMFVPAHLAQWLDGQQFNLFVNTNSMGEMPGPVVRRWFDFIENSVTVDNVFLLNRFLNRSAGNPDACCSLALGPNWEVLDWEVDPDFERSPYTTTLITRNLLVVARRGEPALPPPYLSSVAAEDWALRPYWDNYELKFDGHYPPTNSRADPCLTHDLTMTGSLFKLWEHRRLMRDKASSFLMSRWMDAVSGPNKFEESALLDREAAL